ncbi:hypothetical protein LSAT2_010579 [Lamellibrachia satsuma]|nr:hypothetical protein LSAT2_010579 [Lamellibrachia satsuma]
MGDREMDNILPGDATAGQNATDGIRRNSYSDVAIDGVRRRAMVFVEDSTVRKTGRALNKGDDVRDTAKWQHPDLTRTVRSTTLKKAFVVATMKSFLLTLPLCLFEAPLSKALRF